MKFIQALVLLSLLVILPACGNGNDEVDAEAQEGEREIDVSLPLGEDSHQGIGITAFEENLEEMSNGRLTVQQHYDNALGGEREVFEGMGANTIDAGIVSTGPIGGFLDEALLFDLPYIFENHEHAHQFLDSEYGDQLAEMIEEETDVKVLAWMENGFRYNTNSVRPLETPEDMVDIDHRTQESQVQIETWQELGANATPMAFDELYSSLQQGVLHSQDNPIPTIYDMNFSEVQDYLNMTQHVYHPAPLVMSSDLFESFSEEDQETIIAAAQEALPIQREASMEQEEMFVDELEEQGMEVTYPDLEQFEEAAQPVIEEWRPVIGEDLVDGALNFDYEE